MIKNKKILEFIIIITGILFDFKFIYLLFLFESIRIIKSNGLSCRSLWNLMLWSIILPDNYTPIIFALLACLFEFISRKRTRISYMSVSALLLLTGSVIISILKSVPMVNVLIGLVYISTLIIMLLYIDGRKSINYFLLFETDVEEIINIELIATGLNAIKNMLSCLRLGYVWTDAWSVGTLGYEQQSQFFIIMAAAAVYLFYKLRQGKLTMNDENVRREPVKQTRVRFSLCVVAAISTCCWAQEILCAIGIFIVYLFRKKRKLNVKLFILVPLSIVGVFVFAYFYDSNILSQMYRLVTISQYREYRLAKLSTYKTTFIDIPRKDAEFLLVGNGFANYASRGALTATGQYVSLYEKYFGIYMSDYTEKYIYPRLKSAKQLSNKNEGSVLSRPYSSFIAIMGETGLIGFLIAASIIVLLFCRSNLYQKCVLMVLISSCILENYLEYGKVVIVIGILYCIMNLYKQKSHYVTLCTEENGI